MKQRLFTKLFIGMLIIMLGITIVAHEMIYFLAPVMEEINNAEFFADNDGDSIAQEENYQLSDEITFNTGEYISRAIRRELPYSLVICVLISFVFSFFFSKSISRPIAEMAKTTEEMSKQNRQVRCEHSRTYEIDELAENINNMYETLLMNIDDLEKEKEKVCEAERMKVDFLRAASHELKTPITALNLTLENMMLKVGKYADYDKYIPRCKESAEELGNMVTEILDASKLSLSSENDITEKTNITKIVMNCLYKNKMLKESRDIQLETDIAENIMVPGKKESWEKVVSNIISNAFKYADVGAKVKISLNKRKLTVVNGCSPIEKKDLDHIFEPFYRPDYSRNRDTGGSGIGLYVTDIILRNYGMLYSFEPTSDLNGMKFIICL